MVFTAFGMTLISFAIIQLALLLPASDPANQEAFQQILGLNSISIFRLTHSLFDLAGRGY